MSMCPEYLLALREEGVMTRMMISGPLKNKISLMRSKFLEVSEKARATHSKELVKIHPRRWV